MVKYALICIVVVAFFLRLMTIGFESLDSDEALTIVHSQGSILHNIAWPLSDFYVPLYHVLLSIWSGIFGVGPIISRIPSAVLGTASIIIIYLIGKDLFNEKTATIASVIMAFSSYQLTYSQNARPYALYMLLSLISIYLYLRFIKNPHFSKSYVLTSLLTLYTHAMAPLLLFAQNAHFFFCVRKNVRKWIWMQVLIGILYLPLIAFLLAKTLTLSGKEFLWIQDPNALSIFRIVYSYLSGLTFTLESLILGALLTLYSCFLMAVFIWKDVFYRKIFFKKSNPIHFLILLFVVPFAFLAIYSISFTSVFEEHYMIFTSITLYLLLAASIEQLGRHMQNIALAVVLFLAIITLFIDLTTPNRAQWNLLAESMNEKKADLVFVSAHNAKYALTYYLDNDLYLQQTFGFDDLRYIQGFNDPLIFEEHLSKSDPNSFWLVFHNAEYTDPKLQSIKYAKEHYHLKKFEIVRGAGAYLFEKNQDNEIAAPAMHSSSQYPDRRLDRLKDALRNI